MLLGYHKTANMNQTLGIHSVWATSSQSTTRSIFGPPEVVPKCDSYSYYICHSFPTFFSNVGPSGRSYSTLFVLLYRFWWRFVKVDFRQFGTTQPITHVRPCLLYFAVVFLMIVISETHKLDVHLGFKGNYRRSMYNGGHGTNWRMLNDTEMLYFPNQNWIFNDVGVSQAGQNEPNTWYL